MTPVIRFMPLHHCLVCNMKVLGLQSVILKMQEAADLVKRAGSFRTLGCCRAAARDSLKLMDVGAGKADMSKVVPGFPATVRLVCLHCWSDPGWCFLSGMNPMISSRGGVACCCSDVFEQSLP